MKFCLKNSFISKFNWKNPKLKINRKFFNKGQPWNRKFRISIQAKAHQIPLKY